MRAANPPQLNVATRLRLARLLGMMGSDHDGEALNAARMADRLVHENGLTWPDVVAPMGCGPASVPQPEDVSIDAIRRDWRRAAEWCLRHGGTALRTRDRGFLRNIAGYRLRPSDAQLVWLQGLVNRTLAATGRAP